MNRFDAVVVATHPDQALRLMDYAHPAYTPASVAAQRRLPELSAGVTAFAGAYHGWGFHEDGCRSGVQAARSLGGTGAAMTDRRMKAARPGYADYVDRTSGFIPLPPKPRRRAAASVPPGRG